MPLFRTTPNLFLKCKYFYQTQPTVSNQFFLRVVTILEGLSVKAFILTGNKVTKHKQDINQIRIDILIYLPIPFFSRETGGSPR